MVVASLMTPDPVTICQSESLHTALQTMKSVPCHHLPVVSEIGRLAGILTHHDCKRALNWPYDPRVSTWEEDLARRIPVYRIMIPAPVTVERSTPLERAILLMLREGITYVLVMSDETLVGIMTTSDIFGAFLKLHELDEGQH